MVECGVTGNQTGSKLWPFHVGLYRTVDGETLYFCGATIVSRWFVVGSAHCVLNYPPQMLSVRYGTYDLTQPEQGGRIGVSRVLLHPEYRAQDFSHDIALLELMTMLPYGETVQPACLWRAIPGTGADQDHLEGTLGTTVGWGIGPHNLYTYVLQILEVSASTKRKCIESFDERLFTGDQFFCAVTPVCKGSGGSGFYVKQGDRYFLRGITTFGLAAKGKYLCGVNTLTSLLNVAHYTDWIQQQLQLQQEGATDSSGGFLVWRTTSFYHLKPIPLREGVDPRIKFSHLTPNHRLQPPRNGHRSPGDRDR
ncbi:venom prothrombin activator vestarin-D2-like [Anopheles aquasalis]|uniref:venom prothrombin activator vestarin-D2-like n=1 Tax=Anopheles aquasalis TaxID=42839 RepID=UPI00215A3EC6|nr:venom prothrombin activator vestarin-D2-like [Anopheles aquasalis]